MMGQKIIYLLWEENPVGISVQALYTVRCCSYLWGWEVPELHFQMFLTPLSGYWLHYPPPLKFCHWVEMAIMPGKYFNAIIKVSRSVATQERKCSGKTVETFKIFFHSLKKKITHEDLKGRKCCHFIAFLVKCLYGPIPLTYIINIDPSGSNTISISSLFWLPHCTLTFSEFPLCRLYSFSNCFWCLFFSLSYVGRYRYWDRERSFQGGEVRKIVTLEHTWALEMQDLVGIPFLDPY